MPRAARESVVCGVRGTQVGVTAVTSRVKVFRTVSERAR